jgi:hypothetical protein
MKQMALQNPAPAEIQPSFKTGPAERGLIRIDHNQATSTATGMC